MDPVTHVASGLLAGRAVRDRFPPGRWIIWFAVAAAWIPDIDNFVTYLGPDAYMRIHRGLSHGLAFEALTALVLTFVWTRFKRDAPFWPLFILGWACQIMHSFLDVVTSYGTQILQPFSDARVTVPVVYIVDPFFTGILLVLGAAGLLSKKYGKGLAMAGLAVIAAYPAVNLGVREYVTASFEKALKAEGAAFDAVHVLPTAFTPLAWMAVIDAGEARMAAGFDLFHGGVGPTTPVMRRAEPALLRRLGETAPIFATYAWFTDYPMLTEKSVPGGRELIFTAGRFLLLSPFLSDSWRAGPSAFSLSAVVDDAGKVVSWNFHRPGRGVEEAKAASAP